MFKFTRVFLGKLACTLSVPLLLWAYSSGPDPGYTTAPGDNRTSCIAGGCHVGTLNSSGGKVEILPESGTYTPGATQKIVVRITDAPQKSWGFQMTARTDQNGQAGDFNPADATTQVLCLDGSTKAAGKPCSTGELQWPEHSRTGWSASRGVAGTFSYTVNWTAPATNIGSVTLYASANASNNTDTTGGGHIYATSLTLLPQATAGTKPAITTSNGVVHGATNLPSGIAPNTYISIFGTNLNSTTRVWAGDDFGSGGTAIPTSLSGTSVTVNGKPAYVEFISPTQINAITPSDTATGSGIPVVVTTDGQISNTATVTMNAVAPGFFTFDGKYVAAADALTGAFIGKVGLFPTAPALTSPARPGQILTLYGTGFGPTNPAIADGKVTDKIYNLAPTPVITIGGAAAAVSFAALTPGLAQVYQFNVTVPANAPDGDLQIFAQTNGVSSPNTGACCFVTVKK